MMRSARHTKQVARSDFDRNDRCALGMNVKYAPPGENKPDFIFIVPMLAIETGEHFVEPGGLRMDIDHVGRAVASMPLQAFDLVGIRGKHLVRRRIVPQRVRRLPGFVADTDCRETLFDANFLGQDQVIVRNSQNSHNRFPA